MSDFRLHYQNTKEDYSALVKRLVARSRRRNMPFLKRYYLDGALASFVVVYLFGIAGWFFLDLDLSAISQSTLLFVTLLTVFSLALFFQIWHRNFMAAMAPRSDGLFLQPQTHECSKEGIVIRLTDGMCNYSWKAIMGVEEDEVRYFLLVDNSDGFVVPKSAFSSEEEADRWRKFCESHIAEMHA